MYDLPRGMEQKTCEPIEKRPLPSNTSTTVLLCVRMVRKFSTRRIGKHEWKSYVGVAEEDAKKKVNMGDAGTKLPTRTT